MANPSYWLLLTTDAGFSQHLIVKYALQSVYLTEDRRKAKKPAMWHCAQHRSPIPPATFIRPRPTSSLVPPLPMWPIRKKARPPRGGGEGGQEGKEGGRGRRPTPSDNAHNSCSTMPHTQNHDSVLLVAAIQHLALGTT